LQAQVTYLSGDLRAARPLLAEALRAAEATGYPQAIIDVLTAAALLEMDEGKLPEAQRWLDRASGMARANHLVGYQNGLTFHYARLALLRDQPAVAIRQLQTVLRRSHGAQPAVEYQWRVRLADALIRQGNAAAAERELLRAGTALDSMRAHLA